MCSWSLSAAFVVWPIRAVTALRAILMAASLLVPAVIAHAHDPGLSTAEVRLSSEGVIVTTSFSPVDARTWLESRTGAGVAPAVGDATWLAHVGSWCELELDGRRLAPRATHVLVNSPDTLRFSLEFPGRGGGGVIVLRLPGLAVLPRGHRQFVIVYGADGKQTMKQFLTRDAPMIEIHRPSVAAASAANPSLHTGAAPPMDLGAFVRLGIEHIWTGYDHLLFLFALVVVCRSFGSMATLISCFTVAHSLTLAAATTDLISLPSRWVEVAIAASIVFVGVENVCRRGAEPRHRVALTFCFGLIHGFGFASVLRDLGFGHAGLGVVVPLLGFNLGVELGQVVVAACALPLVWQLRKSQLFLDRGIPALSALVAAAGLYWVVIRTAPVWPGLG